MPGVKSKAFSIVFRSLLYLGAFAAVIFVLKLTGLGLTYQSTPSMPKGWYFSYPYLSIQKGDTVWYKPTPHLMRFMLKRDWIWPGARVLKKVWGVPGDHVCVEQQAIWINGHKIAPIFKADKKGRPLPHWQGCHVLRPHHYFLMSIHTPFSFDSRYFGAINQPHILAKAVKL